ncbi:hypothetical protein NLI96_g123 [Meripilus lineatus]|uniref:DUF6533 domain-containing protein n=1 Tax=Meripilus lineatus TaxID=2056292 RepID=A0AAD5VH25_9APHY|nr:hypothetical protein NLI96_g123 [Physisporinus lineatus]
MYVVAVNDSHQGETYPAFLRLGILYYDFALTFGDEMKYVWQQPKSGASWLFIINRYFSFFADIAVGIGNFLPFESEQGCRTYNRFRQIELIAVQVIVGTVVLLRTYALYGRDKRILYLVLSISSVLLVLSGWSITEGHTDISIQYGCHAALATITGIHVATAWEALFVYDLLIFTLTLVKTYRERSRYLTGNLNELVGLIFRDGAIYFAVMACANAANTLTFYLLRVCGSTHFFERNLTWRTFYSAAGAQRLSINVRKLTTYSRRPTSGQFTSTPSTANSTSLFFTSRFMMPSRPFYLNDTEEDEDTDYSSSVPLPPPHPDIAVIVENGEAEVLEGIELDRVVL